MEPPERPTDVPHESPGRRTGEQAGAPREPATHALEESPAPTTGERAQRKTVDQRRELFARTLQMEVAPGGRIGGRIESQGDLQAVVVLGHINHRLHLILSILTFALWTLFVWLPLVMLRGGAKKRQLINVDEFGLITIQPAEGDLAADISSVLGAPQVAGTFVNPAGLTRSGTVKEATSQGILGGVVGVLIELAHARSRKARLRKGQEAQTSQAAYEGAPSFDTIAYLAVSADEVLIIHADTDMPRSAKIGPEVLGRVARSGVASAELDLRRWLSALRLGFADGGWWEFEVRRAHRDTAEQVARALGGRVG
jgi:hypothetical protein